MTDLESKKVLITAAGQGIGRASALKFAQAGAKVVATDINATTLASLAAQDSRIHTRLLDVQNVAAIQSLSDELGTLDVLFNCVGFVHSGTILDCSQTDWDFSMNLNVGSMYKMCKAFLPAMLAAGSGNIINIASVVSSIKSVPNRFVYTASKAAVIGLTKAIAADYVTRGIRCNAICPGTIATPSLEDRMAAVGDIDIVRASFVARQPIGRLGTAEEIASAALYLASADSAFLTGQTIVIDGGWSN